MFVEHLVHQTQLVPGQQSCNFPRSSHATPLWEERMAICKHGKGGHAPQPQRAGIPPSLAAGTLKASDSTYPWPITP